MNELKPNPYLKAKLKKQLFDKTISWKHFPEYKIFDGGRRFVLRTMQDDPAEFERVAALWRENASYLFRGPYEFVLDPATYPQIFSKGPTFMMGKRYMFVIEFEDEITGAAVLNMDEKNMAIEWAPVIISKTCYSESLCEAVFSFIEQYLGQTGAEYVFALVPVFDRSMQSLLNKLGFKVRGVIPGLILAWAGNESYCRNSIVYMDKFYNDGQELAVEPKDLIPEATRVYNK